MLILLWSIIMRDINTHRSLSVNLVFIPVRLDFPRGKHLETLINTAWGLGKLEILEHLRLNDSDLRMWWLGWKLLHRMGHWIWSQRNCAQILALPLISYATLNQSLILEFMFLTYKMFFETILSNSYSDYICAGFLEVAYNLD